MFKKNNNNRSNNNNIINEKVYPKTLNTYLGQKGFTIPKNELNEEQIFSLKKELTVKPYVQGSVSEPVTYSVYRESASKLYVPRFFGEKHFGPPKEVKILEGEDISIKFEGTLRENQIPVVETFMNNIHSGKFDGLLSLPCAHGKCLGLNTKILMYDGSIKLVQNIKVGDIIMGDDSTPRNILSLARGREMMYKVFQLGNNRKDKNKDNYYIVNKSHILSLKYDYKNKKNNDKASSSCILDISVFEYLKLFKNKVNGILVGYRVPIEFPESSLSLFDPYKIGYWLGNRCSRNKKEDFTFFKILDKYNLLNNNKNNKNKNKHIPLNYKCSSRDNRLKLLQGLFDSNCFYSRNNINNNNLLQTKNKYLEFSGKNKKLINDIVYLSRSLGFDYRIKQVKNTSLYRINIFGYGSDDTDNLLNYKIKLEKMGIDDYYGFEIDGNRRFVLGDFTVTHNTVIGLHLCSLLKKKTLIVVHKEFLMNQWIERMEQFLPGVRIGKIQGAKIEVENTDIVLGMLQSLSMKEYDSSIFDSFGLVIFDEVHHISSEVFSRVLFKLVTKYVIGLSATMERKDGTSYVFRMFLGDVVFKGEREGDEYDVTVRAIEYKNNDEEFNSVTLDYRGNVQYSTLISKLCCFNPRTEFILKVLKDMLIEKPDQQIIVLAHNRNILTYIYDAITSRNICSCGYYVGGMKQDDLKKSESKQVVISTYSMAAEALDIKSLGSLIMCTPKSSIEQVVGRILRSIEGQKLVVDIIDSHQPFRNQFSKRRAFFKKQNYKIIKTNNIRYTTDYNKWDVVFQPGSGSKCFKNNITREDDTDDDDDTDVKNKCLITNMFKKK
jgi:superfamily II DNA or RNA helicase